MFLLVTFFKVRKRTIFEILVVGILRTFHLYESTIQLEFFYRKLKTNLVSTLAIY